MTASSIERFEFTREDVVAWGQSHQKHRNWPVVYVMTNVAEVYVGESLNAEGRMRQHLDSEQKRRLDWVRVVLDDSFNKSACLDLESFLIRMFAGDGELRVLNSNAGVTNADYYERERYRRSFEAVFDQLREHEGLFKRALPDIVNTDLFKLSPFKALNHDQAIAVEDIVEGLFDDLTHDRRGTVVVQGDPGTGKTVVAIYLLKLLEDIKRHSPEEPIDEESIFSDFFTPGHQELLAGLRVAFVIPQQSLRHSVKRVFDRTPGLDDCPVLSPFQVGKSAEPFDILVVDEAHRLNQRAAQAAATLNQDFVTINQRLFGADDMEITQLDWIRKQAKHVILMLDVSQSVRPADLPTATTLATLNEAAAHGRRYALRSQMRIAAGSDYIGYVRAALGDELPNPQRFEGYDLRFFTDLCEMRREILARNEEHGLARLVAGFAWPWRSKKHRTEFDIEIDGEHLRWNSTDRDWVSSPGSEQEVGSIHTVQGYDLNVAGVIIGEDLRFDPDAGRVIFDRTKYFDARGQANNRQRGITYSDDDLLEFVRNIYTVLLTRGIRGTYVYVCDPALRERLRPLFSPGWS